MDFVWKKSVVCVWVYVFFSPHSLTFTLFSFSLTAIRSVHNGSKTFCLAASSFRCMVLFFFSLFHPHSICSLFAFGIKSIRIKKNENRLNGETGTCIWHCWCVYGASSSSFPSAILYAVLLVCIVNVRMVWSLCFFICVWMWKVFAKFGTIGLNFSIQTVHMPLDRITIAQTSRMEL